MLFSKFGINYNKLPQLYRKGTTLIWQSPQHRETAATQHKETAATQHKETAATQHKETAVTQPVNQVNTAESGGRPAMKKQIKQEILVLNVDIIGEQFWKEHPHILS